MYINCSSPPVLIRSILIANITLLSIDSNPETTACQSIEINFQPKRQCTIKLHIYEEKRYVPNPI